MPNSDAFSCANHPGRVAVRTCARCGKPVCDLCSVELVSVEQAFCSERCRDAEPVAPVVPAVDNATLAAGLARPIRTGWALAGRSAGRIATHVLPIAGVAGLAVGVLDQLDGVSSAVVVLAILLLGAFAVTLVGVILSARHTGLVEGSPHAAAARGFVNWLATWVLIAGIVFAGYVALLVPGIYLSLRLFWADEFALIHGKSPFAALKASWELTRNQALTVFVFQFFLALAHYVMLVPAILLFVALIAGLEAAGLGESVVSGLTTSFLFLFGAVVYGALHGPEIVQFYGMRAARASIDAGIAPSIPPRSRAAVAAIALTMSVVFIGIIAAIAIPNLLNAIDRGKGKRTLIDSREIAIAIESFAEANGQYPQAESIEDLQRQLATEQATTLPAVDGWGRRFQVSSAATGYEIRSAGKDGVFEALAPRGATTGFDADIVWQDAELVQWPDHLVFE